MASGLDIFNDPDTRNAFFAGMSLQSILVNGGGSPTPPEPPTPTPSQLYIKTASVYGICEGVVNT